MSSNILILDYGMGNISSVKRKLSLLKVEANVSSSPIDIEKADKIILPGVGHFEKAMDNLIKLKLLDALNEAILVKQKPILGICLGMQLMTQRSEEGHGEGLGWFDAEVGRFSIHDQLKFKIPHTGWNQINIQKNSSLMKDLDNSAEFYFVHAYHVITSDKRDDLNITDYEKPFVSAIEKNNIFGVQYHPEKSHESGDILFKNFLSI